MLKCECVLHMCNEWLNEWMWIELIKVHFHKRDTFTLIRSLYKLYKLLSVSNYNFQQESKTSEN